MTQISALAILTMICAGCANVQVSESALAAALERPIDAHATALAGDDISAMRRTGRVVIATYDAAVAPN